MKTFLKLIKELSAIILSKDLDAFAARIGFNMVQFCDSSFSLLDSLKRAVPFEVVPDNYKHVDRETNIWHLLFCYGSRMYNFHTLNSYGKSKTFLNSILI